MCFIMTLMNNLYLMWISHVMADIQSTRPIKQLQVSIGDIEADQQGAWL